MAESESARGITEVMRTLKRLFFISSGAAVVGLSQGRALAQVDMNPRLPNVLLLVDTSGSMEYLINPDPSDPKGQKSMLPGSANAPGSTCTGIANQTSVMNRWATLATVLTGTIPPSSFSCEALSRSTATFLSEYQYQTANPYDYRYFLPFNRIYSNGCTVGPGQVDPSWNWATWPAKPFTFHDRNGNACSWGGQAADGLLDTFAGRMRFGLMTLDVFTDPGTGAVPGSSPPSIAPADGVTGMWSYFHDWTNSNTNARKGFPVGCKTPANYEVGARNGAAPPWEGRMIPFGDPTSEAQTPINNANIQLEILAMRPYGSTPLAGMLDDAYEFLFNDTTPARDQSTGQTTGHTFGPSDDPYWKDGCRKTFIIVLSDGAPNNDLAGACDPNTTGSCPYATPDQLAYNLRTLPPANQSVLTYVIGFATSNPAALSQLASPPSPLSCENLNITTDCGPGSPAGLKACCALQKIAVMGGTGHAYFADNPTALKQQLSLVLSQIGAGSTARTWPVYFPASTNVGAQGSNFQANPASSYQFLSSFNVTTGVSGSGSPTGGGLWSGNLVRQRYACVSNIPTQQDVKSNVGDDFTANVNANDAAHERKFFTAIANADSGGIIHSDRTIRTIASDDGFGTYAPSATMSLTATSAFPQAMASKASAFGIVQNQAACNSAFATTDASLCTQNIVNWEIGGNNSLPSTVTFVTRDSKQCPSGQTCSKFGAIYHATPAVVGPPSDSLRDDSYISYANAAATAKQPIMLYTATTDGQLHAFKVSSTDTNDTFTTDRMANNELWSFLPPRVLPGLLPNYNSQVILLDGAPVVADVPATNTGANGPTVLERGPTTNTTWKRVLLAGGGVGGGFYYALDITDPTQPKFLWQLASDGNGTPLFGAQVPTPAIASVAIGTKESRKQIPVAILAGGSGTRKDCGTATPPSSPVSNAALSAAKANDALNPNNNPVTVGNALSVSPAPLRCWDTTLKLTQSSGNSLTIARLDTGEVLAHFIGQNYTGAPAPVGGGATDGSDDAAKVSGGQGRVIQAPFIAPLTGAPVAYPGTTGDVADRIYVGDADGLLWRIDLSNPDPKLWTAKVAWDSYMVSGDTSSLREAAQLPPVVSRDPVGNTVILYASADQDTFTSQPTSSRVWSLTETPANLDVSQNWWIKFPPNGRRVTGPITLFNSVAYFATFLPQTGSVCSDGYGSVWGVDYRRADTGNKPYPMAEFPGGSTPTLYVDGTPGTIIYGLSVAATPSCNSSSTSTDAYFGGHTLPTAVTDTTYQLLVPTGAGKGLPPSNTVQNNIPGMQTVKLPPPGRSTRIDSWASIVE